MRIINKISLSDDVWGVPDGLIGPALDSLVADGTPIIFVARDDARLAAVKTSLQHIAPKHVLMDLPAWDCLPFDRLSPDSGLIGRRVDTLSRLVAGECPSILLTTINAALQKLPPHDYFLDRSLLLKLGSSYSQTSLAEFLSKHAYLRTDTVREAGEFAIRGGIVDVFPSGQLNPVRFDFFGDEIEGIRNFDAASQRSFGNCDELVLRPVAEFMLNDENITRFRTGYLKLFGAAASRDSLYESVSAGRTHPGIEHWLPLFYDKLMTLNDYCPGWPILLDHEAEAASFARQTQIQDFFEARRDSNKIDDASSYRPLVPDQLYMSAIETESLLFGSRARRLFTFAAPTAVKTSDCRTNDAGGRAGINLATSGAALAMQGCVEAIIDERRGKNRPIVIACSSLGGASRLSDLLEPLIKPLPLKTITDFSVLQQGDLHLMQWPLWAGFQTEHILVFAEPDIFGQRLSRPKSKRGRGDDFLREVSALETGDFVVHAEHGIARYEGLLTINSGGGDHDCLHLVYAGDNKLYLPVENIELLSRYGSSGSEAQLDRLGGAAWQARVARIKGRVRVMAEQLIAIAAQRFRAKAEPLVAEGSSYTEFCSRFTYAETEDQLNAIADVVDDLGSGNASDRLICGDVGFGKTEVALRAAFISAMAGYQVAVVVPTTLLARQHGKVFTERFSGFPLNIGVLSRMTSAVDSKKIRSGIANGDVQIAIGTHALLSNAIDFNNLGLLIIDEEQHFGVAQKERLKRFRGDIHVLSLSATPIPRTLQMALSGVREMSLITTPPVDRLAVRTFVGPWDGVVLREAIQREMFRGGQSFVVCPRIDDMQRVYDRVTKLAPEARLLTAHGRMLANELDSVMTQFADGQADILLSTNIVESGIDIPSANTMIIHRADMFGLSQLYQLRGRVGRGRQRAYAYLTSDPKRLLSSQARRRLEVMQTLDTLGAGFTLASYDMDIRGAGNLLGDEQSGHVREVGVELYQEMLREAVDAAKLGKAEAPNNQGKTNWTPQINLGIEVRIPEAYIPDLNVRLSVYRRIGNLADSSATDIMIAELVDRFGALPESVRNLFAFIELKQLCRIANVEKVDAGPKGLSFSFRDESFARPDHLIGWISDQADRVQLRSDHRLFVKASLQDASLQLSACLKIVQDLIDLL